MKTLHSFSSHGILMLLLLYMSLLIITGCQEQEVLTPDQNVIPRSSLYSVVGVLGYLQDSLNTWYCRPGDEYGSTLVFIDTFEVEVNGFNQVSQADLEDLAEEIALTAGGYYYDRSTSNKAPFMFEIRQAGSIEGGKLPISSWFIMEEGDPCDVSDTYPYEITWPYGHGEYISCDAEPTGSDAPDLFRRDLRSHITYGLKHGKGSYGYNRLYTICFNFGDNCSGYEVPFVWADEFIEDLDNPIDPQNGDNYYDDLLFFNYSGFSNFHDCLNPSEMNFYYQSMKDLAEDQLGSPGVGSRVIVQVEVGYNEIFSEYTTLLHSMQIYYANIITAQSNQVPLPDPYN